MLVSSGSWPELLLITTFKLQNRYSRDIIRFREHVYDSSKSFAQFLSEAWILWQRVTKDKLSGNDAAEAVIGRISDERLRIELLNACAKSVSRINFCRIMHTSYKTCEFKSGVTKLK